MRVGLVSDIHANRVAFEAVLDDMPSVDHLVCAGDVVGYNPSPAECVETVREREIPTVLGNHDRAVAEDDIAVRIVRGRISVDVESVASDEAIGIHSWNEMNRYAFENRFGPRITTRQELDSPEKGLGLKPFVPVLLTDRHYVRTVLVFFDADRVYRTPLIALADLIDRHQFRVLAFQPV